MADSSSTDNTQFLHQYQILLSTAGAIIAFLFGVYKYLGLQRAKHIENLFKIKEDVEKFVARPEIKQIFLLTDYRSYKFERYNYDGIELDDIYFKDAYISYALRPHKADHEEQEKSKFTLFETHIRATYDAYFTELEKYYYYVKIKVFDVDFLRPYFGYYIDIHCTSDKSKLRKRKEDIDALHNYMVTYYPKNLCHLYRLFGHRVNYTEIEYKKPEGYDEWLEKINKKIDVAEKAIASNEEGGSNDRGKE